MKVLLKELDPIQDLEINEHELTKEYKELSILLYRYLKLKASAQKEFDMAEARYEEMKNNVYKSLKSDTTKKYTEAALQAEIETTLEVLSLRDAVIEAKYELGTHAGAVDSMKAKKDMLIQLGADSRKETQ